MIVRLKLVLEQDEYTALSKLAIAQERNPEGQLRYILRSELNRLGLLVVSTGQNLKQDDLNRGQANDRQ